MNDKVSIEPLFRDTFSLPKTTRSFTERPPPVFEKHSSVGSSGDWAISRAERS